MNDYRKNARIVGGILLSILLIFMGLLSIWDGVAFADVPTSYNDALASMVDGADWYFGAEHLNIDAVKSVVDGWRSDSNYDFERLKQDPIVIAVVDSGIGHAYTDETLTTKVDVTKVYDSGKGYVYSIHEVFDDVLLKDEDGNYVYKNTASSVIIEKKGTVNAVTDSGNIALDLVDNTQNNHGTHVTGIVALLIHAFGLEDYVKILPIKANNLLTLHSGEYRASYNNQSSMPVVYDAIEFAEEKGADIVNLSLAADYSNRSNYVGEKMKRFGDNMVLVAAAGNLGKEANKSELRGDRKACFPAASSYVIGVMNCAKGNVLNSGSNFGTYYDVAAPGSGILSAIDGKNGYGTLSGTSMATPMTSFACALALLRYRALVDNDVEMTPKLVRSIIDLSSVTTSANNGQPTLNTLNVVTLDFLGFDDMYVSPDEISIVTTSDREQTLGNTDSLRFRAELSPSNARTNDIVYWWYEFGGQSYPLGIGEEIEMQIPTVVGDGYVVKCQLQKDENDEVGDLVCSTPFVFSVNYQKEKDVVPHVLINEHVDTEDDIVDYYARLSVDLSYLNPNISYVVTWLVNGDEKAVGNEFYFIPDNSAEVYDISCKINDTVSINTVSFNICQQEQDKILNDYENALFLQKYGVTRAEMVTIIVCSAVAFAEILAILTFALLKRKARNNASDHSFNGVSADDGQNTHQESENDLTDENGISG